MAWQMNFISEEDFTHHIKETMDKYTEKIEKIDLKKFNNNIIDPIKLLFDKTIYNVQWEEVISNEIFRQRDKANNNDIGYFHQYIFKYIKGCNVPKHGWDVIYKNENGIQITESDRVNTVYVEMKNKHNTMNSTSSAKTYIKMQNQLLNDDNCACLLVEAIAKTSQNIKWSAKVDGKNLSHKLIRRVSMDKFYELVTGQSDAFYQICKQLPLTLEQLLQQKNFNIENQSTVLEELKQKNPNMLMSLYLLAFQSYNGFINI